MKLFFASASWGPAWSDRRVIEGDSTFVIGADIDGHLEKLLLGKAARI